MTPTGFDLLVQSFRQRLARPQAVINAARALLDDPTQLAESLRDTASGLTQIAHKMRICSDGPINGPTTATRAYQYARFPVSEFKLIKNEFGGTINDVVLAVVAGGLRTFFLSRGVDPEDEDIRAMCPVSIRDTSEKTAFGNRLAMLIVDLPLWVEDPVARLQDVRDEVDLLKDRKQAVGADFLLNLAGFAPPTLHAMVARTSLRQLGFNLIVTNIPGPQFPLYCQGSRLVEAFPVAFLYDQQQMAVAIFSYCGSLNLGVLADAHALPDMDVLMGGFREAFAELVAAANDSVAARSAQELADVASAGERTVVARTRRTAPTIGKTNGTQRAAKSARSDAARSNGQR